MLKVFKTRYMYEIPKFGKYFRCGREVGKYIFVGLGIAIMWK